MVSLHMIPCRVFTREMLTGRDCSSNLLYPKEDRATNQLMFTCRTCHVGEPASSYCVYQNKLNSQVGDTAGVTQDVGSDPTVGLPGLSFESFLSIPGFCACCGQEVTCSICGQTAFTLPKHATVPKPTEAAIEEGADGSDLDARSRRSSTTSTNTQHS